MENLKLFPIDNLYCLAQKPFVLRYIEIAYFVIFRYFNFFHRVCKKHRVQILHIHFGYHGAKSVGLKKKLRVPLICSFYGDDAFADKHRGKYAYLFKEADRILVLGPYMKERLVKLGCPEPKLVIHHLGIDIEKIRYQERFVSRGEPIKFLIASSFLPKKGIDLALKSLSDLATQYDFKLDIVGDGPLRPEIQKLIIDGQISDRVTLHGYRPYEYFINLTYSCHVFIQASRTTENNNKEGTPMAIVDAMASGLAVVSTKHSDIPEIVLDNYTGYLAEENDLASLTACLTKVLENPQVIPAFSKRGRERVEQEFDARKQTLKLEQYYQELITTATITTS